MLRALNEQGEAVYIDSTIVGENYYCPHCKNPVLRKMGEMRTHHFAHYPKRHSRSGGSKCTESWSHDMSEWHRLWQEMFPEENREQIISDGKKTHFADVLINNTVIEFQHSPIDMSEFEERNIFYTGLGYKVIWVFDLRDEYYGGFIKKTGNEKNCIKCSWERKKRPPFFEIGELNDDVSIFMELDDEEPIRLVVYNYDGFNRFGLSEIKSFAKGEFEEIAKDNISNLFKYSGPDLRSVEIPKEFGCKIIRDLWKKEYENIIVSNIITNEEWSIYGQASLNEILSSFEDQIEGYKTWRENGRYRYSKKSRIIKYADRPIWKLKKSRKHGEKESSKCDTNDNVKIGHQGFVLTPKPNNVEIPNCQSIVIPCRKQMAQEEINKRFREKQAANNKALEDRNKALSAGLVDESEIIKSLQSGKCPKCGLKLDKYPSGEIKCRSFYKCGYIVPSNYSCYVRKVLKA